MESYWSSGRPTAMRSADGRIGLVRAADDEEAAETLAAHITTQIVPRATTAHPGPGAVKISVAGPAQLGREVDAQAGADLTRAELLTSPMALLILLLVFGSAVAVALSLSSLLVFPGYFLRSPLF
ncbi:MMPL family transporter [Actinomadura sp. 6N118]|uniref:MMPL family transporter n=1 Tax=Actinomadura sp. 6N118 TaxID=3375151 RepID=UPI0037A591A2